MGGRRVFLDLPRGVRRAFGLVEDFCVYCSNMCVLVLVPARSTFFLPGVPLPLLEMREAINSKQRNGAVILVRVV